MKKSTFIKLGVVAALVMLPRRSSKKSGCGTGCGCSKTDDKSNKDAAINASNNDSKTGCDCKNCICPLCRIGKCPLCAIGKCFCCKKSADKKVDKAEK